MASVSVSLHNFSQTRKGKASAEKHTEQEKFTRVLSFFAMVQMVLTHVVFFCVGMLRIARGIAEAVALSGIVMPMLA